MTSRDFAYWLQGFFEIQNPIELTTPQIEMIKAHLNLVFIHEIDPSIDKFHTKEEVIAMNEIHNKPTLQELGEQHGFSVYDGGNGHNFGPCPGPDYKLSILHGWYNVNEGIPRC